MNLVTRRCRGLTMCVFLDILVFVSLQHPFQTTYFFILALQPPGYSLPSCYTFDRNPVTVQDFQSELGNTGDRSRVARQALGCN